MGEYNIGEKRVGDGRIKKVSYFLNMKESAKEHIVLPPPAELFSSLAEMPPGSTGSGAYDAWVLGITLSGSAWLNDRTDPFELKPGVCILMHPRLLNRWRVPEKPDAKGRRSNWRCISVIFVPRPHWQALLNYPQFLPGYSLIEFKSAAIRRRVRRGVKLVHRYASATFPMADQYAMNALERVLLLCWNRQKSPPSRLDPRIQKAIAAMTARLNQPLRLDSVARECHLSRSHLANLFKAQVGVPPIRFQERQRLARAAQMLRLTIYSVRQIAESVGFDDPRYFCKRFKKNFSLAPRAYRKNSLRRKK